MVSVLTVPLQIRILHKENSQEELMWRILRLDVKIVCALLSFLKFEPKIGT